MITFSTKITQTIYQYYHKHKLTQISLLLCIYGQNQHGHPFVSSVWCFIFFDRQEGKTGRVGIKIR